MGILISRHNDVQLPRQLSRDYKSEIREEGVKSNTANLVQWLYNTIQFLSSAVVTVKRRGVLWFCLFVVDWFVLSGIEAILACT